MKRLTFGVCFLLGAGTTGWAQKDITADYLQNPSFENDAAQCTDNASSIVKNGTELRGWNIMPSSWQATSPGVSLIINENCATDNNFGNTAAADGEWMYYQRVGWTAASSELKQTTSKVLAPGNYRITFNYKAFYANNATSSALIKVSDEDGSVLASSAISCAAGSAGCMTSSTWNTCTVNFKVASEGAVTLSSAMSWLSGGSQMAYDNFRLYTLPEGEAGDIVIEGETEKEVTSPTEGVITHDFVSEADMKQDLLQMLANFTTYANNIWYNCAAPNSKDEACGYFKANSAGQNNEDGVRTNADLSMVMAFLYKYGQDKVTLPAGITWEQVKDMAMKSLVFGYSTHKANKFKITSNNAYWGSVSNADHVWESSLWAMSLAYASHFLKDELSEEQKEYIYNMIKAECNYELERSIPTGYNGDTKAEENGWETNILASALGLYPNDALAPQWFARLREFAINCYSQRDDADDNTIIDPEYDKTTVAQLYRGRNLYDDFTLQNHSYFHTSYQNVVMQELGESQLALALFQGENAKWSTNALMHNNDRIMDDVLRHLALADGELAMPNGNDWSMFLYDQITSYTMAACFLRNPDALLLENMAYKHIKARQSTTSDGSWLLNSDIGPRRMGVEAHRVMMTYLMHDMASTASLTPTSWDDFSARNEQAHLFLSQNIVRANNKHRFMVFSWSAGLKSYTGYFASNKADKNKIVVPFKASNTGNLLGWYNVQGKGTNASATVPGIYQLKGNSFAMNGQLSTNDNTLENSFAIYTTPGNAIIYIDQIKGKAAGTISSEQGALLAISTDAFTKTKRTIYHAKGRSQTDGTQLKTFASSWANIDNEVGIISSRQEGQMAFGDRTLSSSIYLSKFYGLYNAQPRSFTSNEVIDRRHVAYYNNVDSATTAQLSALMQPLTELLPQGWNGCIVADPDSARYMLVSNFTTAGEATLKGISSPWGAPVLSETTIINDNAASVTLQLEGHHSSINTLRAYIKGNNLQARQVENDSCAILVQNMSSTEEKTEITLWCQEGKLTKSITLEVGQCIMAYVKEGHIVTDSASFSSSADNDYINITAQTLKNAGFELDKTWSKQGSLTLGNTTYNPCYLITTTAVNSDYPQVQPIEGWTTNNALTGASKFAVAYSMPYSNDTYCVSPSQVGNSASIIAPVATFDGGNRCFSTLNSWTSGTNAITQKIKLTKGDYQLRYWAKYVCANQGKRLADDVITSNSDNINYSLCGVKYNDIQLYAYPTAADTWQQIVIPFTLNDETEVEVSMGLKTTASVGAANNTRLYVDAVELYAHTDNPTAITTTQENDKTGGKVYNLAGIQMQSEANSGNKPAKGIYIVNHKKVAIQ